MFLKSNTNKYETKFKINLINIKVQEWFNIINLTKLKENI